jgi:hypothetical protein
MNNNEFENYYQILGLPDFASIEEVKKAFRELAQKYHPDRGGDPEKFKKILKAYKVLSNSEEKEKYDEILWLYTEDANIYNSAKEQKSAENFSSTIFIWQSNKTKTPTLLEGVLNFLINISPGILNIVKTLFNAIFSFNFSSLLLGILGLLLGFYIFYYILLFPFIIHEIINNYSLSFFEKIMRIILRITLGLFLLDIMITFFSNLSNFLGNKEFQIPYRDLNSFKRVYREHLFGLSMFCLVSLFLGYFMSTLYYKNIPNTDNSKSSVITNEDETPKEVLPAGIPEDIKNWTPEERAEFLHGYFKDLVKNKKISKEEFEKIQDILKRKNILTKEVIRLIKEKIKIEKEKE